MAKNACLTLTRHRIAIGKAKSKKSVNSKNCHRWGGRSEHLSALPLG